MIGANALTSKNGCDVELIRAPPRSVSAGVDAAKVDIENSEIMKAIDATRGTTRREMFVLPSQMNGAEYSSPMDHSIVGNVTKGSPNYTSDNTGGPRGQLACDLDIAQYICDHASNSKRPDGINYVRDVIRDIPGIELKNGYLTEMPAFSTQDLDLFVEARHKMDVLLSRNIAVKGMVPSFPLHSGVRRQPGPLAKAARVDLVYASAVPYGTYGNGTSKRWERVCRVALEQQYYLALAAAARCIRLGKHSSYKIHFMPLGGGVFGNKLSWIFEALTQALKDAQATFLTKEMACALTICIMTFVGKPEEFQAFSKLHSKGGARTAARKPPPSASAARDGAARARARAKTAAVAKAQDRVHRTKSMHKKALASFQSHSAKAAAVRRRAEGRETRNRAKEDMRVSKAQGLATALGAKLSLAKTASSKSKAAARHQRALDLVEKHSRARTEARAQRAADTGASSAEKARDAAMRSVDAHKAKVEQAKAELIKAQAGGAKKLATPRTPRSPDTADTTSTNHADDDWHDRNKDTSGQAQANRVMGVVGKMQRRAAVQKDMALAKRIRALRF